MTASVRKSLCVVTMAGSLGASKRCCVNNPNSFCYMRGCYVVKKQKRNTTTFVKNSYFTNLRIEVGDQDKK